MKSNELIRSAIHQPYESATAGLGLPEFPRSTFTQEIGQHLRAAGSLFEDDPKTIRKLWNATLRGDVLLTEQEQDKIVFYVRAQIGGRIMDVRLALRLQTWSVDSVVAMHRRPLFRTSGFTGATTVVAVLVAGLVGFEVNGPLAQKLAPVFPWLYHGSSRTVMVAGIGQPTGIQDATANSSSGAVTAGSSQQSSTQVSGGNAASSSDAPSSSTARASIANASSGGTASSVGSTASTTPSSSSTGAGEVSFTLKSGMPLHDLSVFLEQNQIIQKSAASFDHSMTTSGVDRTVRPGTYTFKKGMTQQQIFNVLKHPK